MAPRKHNWMWRRLEEREAEAQRRPRTVNYRRPDFMLNKQGMTVRFHVAHPTTPAHERFVALTERVEINGDTCIVWRGGDTFRVDDETVTTPARFYWEMMLGERLSPHESLYRTCKTAGCVKHREKR